MRGVAAFSAVHIVGSLEGGGAERWVRELAPRIARRGVTTKIITVYAPNLDADEIAALGCPVHSRAKRPGPDPIHFAWLVRELRRHAPDVVHTHQWAGKYVGRAAAILAAVPVLVHTEHSPLPVSPFERSLARAFASRTNAVVSFNEHKAELIRMREPVRRFEIIRNGLPIEPKPTPKIRAQARKRLGVLESDVVFGFVASLQPRKNPDLAIRAFARVAHDGTAPVRLEIFGDGPMRADLETLAASLGVRERVVFHGFVSGVREMLPGLDVFVTTASQEMAPISMLEAMVAELPIIGTPHPGTIEMVDDERNGAVVDWDEEAIADAMRRARDDSAWRSRCGKAGRARVERDYDIEVIADQHVALYERLLRERFASVMKRLPDRHHVEVGKP